MRYHGLYSIYTAKPDVMQEPPIQQPMEPASSNQPEVEVGSISTREGPPQGAQIPTLSEPVGEGTRDGRKAQTIDERRAGELRAAKPPIDTRPPKLKDGGNTSAACIQYVRVPRKMNPGPDGRSGVHA